MARSRNKHSRAALRAKSRRRPKQGSSRWFTITITVIILVGVIGVVMASGMLTRNDSASAAPQPPSADNPSGDHWHAAMAVNVCGEWLTAPAEFETAAGNSNVRVGIHTHGDGFVHIHPFTVSEGGSNATLGKFFDYGGWSVSQNSFDVWAAPSFDPTKTEWKDGDKCPNAAGEAGKGKAGEVVFEVNCKTVSGNPSDHKLADQEVVAIGFLPKGEEMGAPPNAASAPQDDGSPAGAINQKACTPTTKDNPGVADTIPTTQAATTPTTQQ